MKNLNITYLLDFYGNLLSEKMLNIMELYYMDDLSLSEIAQQTNLTRQGVRDYIVRGERELLKLEESLKLYEKFCKIQDVLGDIKNTVKPQTKLSQSDYDKIIKLIDDVENII